MVHRLPEHASVDQEVDMRVSHDRAEVNTTW